MAMKSSAEITPTSHSPRKGIEFVAEGFDSRSWLAITEYQLVRCQSHLLTNGLHGTAVEEARHTYQQWSGGTGFTESLQYPSSIYWENNYHQDHNEPMRCA